jgi:hypothetical protein
VCRETAPNVMDVERSLKDRINFVMLNVDNAKARTRVCNRQHSTPPLLRMHTHVNTTTLTLRLSSAWQWAPEMSEYDVDGIPHFVFLDGAGRKQGQVIGRLPKEVLRSNADALVQGVALPYAKAAGAHA